MAKESAAKAAPDPAEDPAVPHNYALSCRVCGAAISFHSIPDNGAMECPNCGKLNLVPEEWINAAEGGE